MIPSSLVYLMNRADDRYGPFASTHEAMGVALEEWQEFVDAVRSNDMVKIHAECLDLAAVMLRLARQINEGGPIVERSKK